MYWAQTYFLAGDFTSAWALVNIQFWIIVSTEVLDSIFCFDQTSMLSSKEGSR